MNLSAEYFKGKFHGEALTTDKDFVYPSFYNNLEGFTGLSIKALMKTNPYLSLGIGAEAIVGNNWQLDDYLHYNGAEMKLLSVTPCLRLRNSYKTRKFHDRALIFIELAPMLGVVQINIEEPVFEIFQNGNFLEPILQDRAFTYGVKCHAGAGYALTQLLGISASYAFGYYKVSSVLNNDRSFVTSQFNVGIYLKLMGDKRYKYR